MHTIHSFMTGQTTKTTTAKTYFPFFYVFLLSLSGMTRGFETTANLPPPSATTTILQETPKLITVSAKRSAEQGRDAN
jgi:hypothetical protein